MSLIMDDLIVNTILKCRIYLLKNIDYSCLRDFLIQEQVLTKSEIETIDAKSDRKSRIREILDVIPRRSDEVFISFIKSLNFSKQQHISQHIVDVFQEFYTKKGSLKKNEYINGCLLKMNSSSKEEMQSDDEESLELKIKRDENEDVNRLCLICSEKYVNIAFMCGHCVCDVCAKKMIVCHLCRKNINEKIPLYF